MPLQPKEMRKELKHLLEGDKESRRKSNEVNAAVINSLSDERGSFTNNNVNLTQLQRPTINQANVNKSPAISFRKLTPRIEPSRINNPPPIRKGKPFFLDIRAIIPPGIG